MRCEDGLDVAVGWCLNDVNAPGGANKQANGF